MATPAKPPPYSDSTLPNNHYWHAGGATGTIVRAALRTLQFTLAIIIAALYGADLASSTSSTSHANASWIYAEVAAALSALTCIVHCFVTVKRVLWCFWDFVLVVLWAAQVGVFGSMYLGSSASEPENVDLTESVQRMRAGMGLGIVCMILWFATFVLAVAFCCSARKITRGTERVERRREMDVRGEGERQRMNRVSDEADEIDLEKAALNGKMPEDFGSQDEMAEKEI